MGAPVRAWEVSFSCDAGVEIGLLDSGGLPYCDKAAFDAHSVSLE